MTTPLVPWSDLSVRRSQLGIRCVDASTGRPAPETITAELHARFGSRRVYPAVRGPSGVLSFHSLPRLRALEDADLGITPVPAAQSLEFALYVEDPSKRFLPVTMLVRLPRPAATSRVIDLPLFPGSLYEAPAHWAVLRAQLADRTVAAGSNDWRRFPARWAYVELAIGSTTVARAMSDHRGELTAVMPYPTDAGVTTWWVTLTARHRSLSQQELLPPRQRPRTQPPEAPELNSLLSQPAAPVVPVWGGGTGASIDFMLAAGVAPRVFTAPNRDALWLAPNP